MRLLMTSIPVGRYVLSNLNGSRFGACVCVCFGSNFKHWAWPMAKSDFRFSFVM